MTLMREMDKSMDSINRLNAARADLLVEVQDLSEFREALGIRMFEKAEEVKPFHLKVADFFGLGGDAYDNKPELNPANRRSRRNAISNAKRQAGAFAADAGADARADQDQVQTGEYVLKASLQRRNRRIGIQVDSDGVIDAIEEGSAARSHPHIRIGQKILSVDGVKYDHNTGL
jgi:hypothetical protein